MSALASSWASDEGQLFEGVIVVGLGGNLGGPEAVSARFASALDVLSRTWGPSRVSSSFVTAPVGDVQAQPDFLNAVAAWRPPSPPTPESALEQLLKIEVEHGRIRSSRGGPRSLDLDLLLVGRQERNDTNLSLPHPRICQRAFVLEPLCELFGPEFRIGPEGPRLAECLASAQVAAQVWSRLL
jgi:2-amino-4-hydroxy-6-hydroxymethyldihydropteridine diphosphokinase